MEVSSESEILPKVGYEFRPKDNKLRSKPLRKQSLQNPNSLLRTNLGLFETAHSTGWGSYLVPVADPDAPLEITQEDAYGIRLEDNFPKIPPKLWSAWMHLVFYMYPGLEVSCLLLRKEDDLSQWKIVIPRQQVSGASVNANFVESCDLITGETYKKFPIDGYIHAGSSHSHHSMDAFFSGTDDANELGVPGLHIVVGRVSKLNRSYTALASVVLRHQRKEVLFKDVVDPTPTGDEFHPEVLRMVNRFSQIRINP